MDYPDPNQYGRPSYGDFAAILTAHEAREKEWHDSIVSHLVRVEERLHTLEMEVASNRPLIKGASGAAFFLFCALVSGVVGAYFKDYVG